MDAKNELHSIIIWNGPVQNAQQKQTAIVEAEIMPLQNESVQNAPLTKAFYLHNHFLLEGKLHNFQFLFEQIGTI
jgi:hypothetical protein